MWDTKQATSSFLKIFFRGKQVSSVLSANHPPNLHFRIWFDQTSDLTDALWLMPSYCHFASLCKEFWKGSVSKCINFNPSTSAQKKKRIISGNIQMLSAMSVSVFSRLG